MPLVPFMPQPLSKEPWLSWWREGAGVTVCGRALHPGAPTLLCSAVDIPLPSFVLQEICASSVPNAAPCSIANRCGSHALLISLAGSGRCLLPALRLSWKGWAACGNRRGYLSRCARHEAAGSGCVGPTLPLCWAGRHPERCGAGAAASQPGEWSWSWGPGPCWGAA